MKFKAVIDLDYEQRRHIAKFMRLRDGEMTRKGHANRASCEEFIRLCVEVGIEDAVTYVSRQEAKQADREWFLFKSTPRGRRWQGRA